MSTTSKVQGHLEGKRNLPVGWRRVKLGEVVDCFSGAWGQDAEFEGSTTVKVVGTSHISNEGLLDHRDAPIRFLSRQEMTALCYEGDLMVVKSSGSAANIRSGKTAMCSNDLSGHIACSNFLLRLIPRAGEVEPFLLWAYLNSENTKEFVRRIAGSSTYPNIKWSSFRVLEIFLPPFSEQQRIARILRGQMETVEKARVAAQARLEAVKALPAAFLRKEFPKPDKPLPDSWRILPLGDAGEVVSGVTIGRAINGEDIREVPYLRVANVKDGYLDLLDVVTTSATPNEIEALRLRQGDLLLTEGGDPDKLGRGALWEEQLPECIHQNHIFRVRLNRNLVLPTYAAVLIGSSYGKGYFLRHAKQTTGIATINQRVLKAFPILLPSLPEQQRIAALLHEQLAAVEKARTAAEEELNSISFLPAALLRRAFSGEI
jgi:type I restriction enzyme S subunit